ncbi:MAG: biopolymer transporter ExbD [Massilia sp.]|jgi:hypothetical protein|nr:biopolymer transporter ExbD [Massilia sp.]MDB5950453.1 biopolymer transporter ExbD [Massilia sp.]
MNERSVIVQTAFSRRTHDVHTVSRYKAGQMRTLLAASQGAPGQARENPKNPSIHFQKYEYIGKVAYTAQRAGIQKVGFITEPPDKG